MMPEKAAPPLTNLQDSQPDKTKADEVATPLVQKPKKLLDQVSEALRTKHYAYRTEKTYIDWIKRYILFHKKRHPKDMGANEIRAFIGHLATERKVATSTQNQALSAILFLYRIVLQIDILVPPELVHPSRPKRLPTVLTHAEAMSVINSCEAPRVLWQRSCMAADCA
jgi:site-specific recombinase XerD